MAFGLPNPFGGSSSSDKDKNQSSSSTHESTLSDNNNNNNHTSSSIFSSSTTQSQPQSYSNPISSSSSSSEIKTRLQTAISTQSNVANAKALISRINENCFDHCVPAPGTSLSSKEQTCLSSCMEKYIEAWNVVSRTYIARLQREGAAVNAAAAAASAQAGSQTGFF